MYYRNGLEVKLSDRIQLPNGEFGSVVLSIDTDEYSVEFPKSEWSHLKEGVMVKADGGALVHLDGSHSQEIVRVPE